MRSALGVSLVLALSCARPPDAQPSAAPKARAVASSVPPLAAPPSKFDYDVDGFVYARPEKSAAPVPARFSAPLPTSVEELKRPEAYPPPGQTSRALCEGDQSVQRRWLDAVRAAVKRGPVERELHTALIDLVGYCESKPLCEWLAATAATEQDRGVREVLYPPLVDCGSVALPVFERDQAADEELVTLYRHTYANDFPFSARFKAAIAAVSKKGRGKALRDVALALRGVKDDGVVPFVEALQKPLDPESRAWLGLAFADRPKAEAEFREACGHPEVGKEIFCVRSQRRPPTPPLLFQEEVMERKINSGLWLAEHPDRRAILKIALLACVRRAPSPPARSGCFDDLAAHFWSDAHALLRGDKAPSFEDEPYHTELESAVRRFPSRDDLVQHLRNLGVLPDGFAIGPGEGEDATTARDVLRAAGRLQDFDVETDAFPNEHDALLAELAAMTGQALSGVYFEEVAPDPEGPRDEQGLGEAPYLLRAYANGQRYSLEATDYGDWYDLEAVVGLLNALLRERGSSTRFLPLYTGDQWASVAVGKRESLARLVLERLLATEASSEKEAEGQMVERRRSSNDE